MLFTSLAWAQATAIPEASRAQLAKYDKNNNGRLDPDERAVLEADDAKAGSAAAKTNPGDPGAGEVMVLSPFEVKGNDDNGYASSHTLSGTRVNSRIEDLGASITVVNKQQLLDTAALDINDIFLFESNTEGTTQFSNFSVNVNGFISDDAQENPAGSNRVRGLGAANMSVGGFQTNGRIAVDTYNLDSVEILRGPNSNLFGLGDAAGTVNVNQSQGNLTREITSLTLRGDSWGGFRSSVDLNRPIIRNKLAVRVSGLYDSRGFTRKPSYDIQRRYYGALTYRPFSSTTIRGSFESVQQKRQTPNSQTPRDMVTQWIEAGKPTWDPVTFRARVDGVQTAPITNDANLPRGLGIDTTQYTRPGMYIEGNGEVVYWSPSRLQSTGANPNANVNSNQRISSTFSDLIRNRSTLYPLFTAPSISNKALYDWEDINFSATNWNSDKALRYELSIDQKVFHTPTHSLYGQAAWRYEDWDNYTRNVVRETNFLNIDINERLLDGRNNPYFLRPYIAVWDGSNPANRSSIDDTMRAQLAYQLNLTRQSRWISWLGEQQVTGYYEDRKSTARTHNSREAALSDHIWSSPTNRVNGSASARASYRYYVGDAQGFNVDYAPPKSGVEGTFAFHYLADPTTGRFTDDMARFGEAPYTASRNRTEVITRGINLQSFLFGSRIVTTVGQREDAQRTRGTPGILVNSSGFYDWSTLETQGWNAWTYRSGDTKQKAVVVRPFKGWKFIDSRADGPGFTAAGLNLLRNVGFHYNRSDSFRPIAPAKNLLGEELPNPNGQNEEYGFSISLNRKLTARVNWYKTEQKDARVSGGASTAVGRTSNLDWGNSTYNLEDWATRVVTARPNMVTASAAQIRTEVYKLMQLPEGWIEQFDGFGTSDVNDVSSKGLELELSYNPSNNLRLKLTAARNETIDSNLSGATQDYINLRMPAWTTIKDDAGAVWWTTSGAREWYVGFVEPVLKLARVNQGLPRSQIKKWTWSGLANYSFSQGRLKGFGVGSSVRWADKSAIGFYGIPDSDGVMRSYDRSRPIYDPARASYDFNASYSLRLFGDKIGSRIQLNVRDAFSRPSLRAVAVNPDGMPNAYRIVDGPQYILTTTFDF